MMRNSFILLTKILVTFVFILCITSAESASNTFTEKGLSLLGYHLCNYSVIKNVSKTVAYQKSYEKQTPCGGWIPWKMCSTTYYKEEYHPIMVQEAVNVTDCCAGYEQVGLYCSLSINRSSEFASRPGACPTKIGEALKSSCVSDMDCPEYKKCCKTSMGTHCSDPVPEEQTVTKYWYNVSVLVKMDFSELNKVDPKLLNHSRLLHSMITGALWPMNISVYHIQTKSETYAETLVSYVLVGLQQLVPLVNISSLLKEIVKRVSEVIDIVVQDCDPDMPNVLIKNKHSSNLLRSSRSASPEIHGSVDLECDSPPIRNHKIFNVTCSSFEASWSVNSLQNHSFRAEVYKGKKLVERMETTDMKLTMLNLEAGVMYTMDISYEACGKNITSSRTVKTGEILDPVTTQGSNVTHNTTTPFSMAEIQAVTSFTKYTEATVLPSSSIQESSTLPAEKALSASQKMNVSGHVRNDSILNSPETATPAPKWWGNVTILNGTVAEELSTLPAEKILSASQKMNVSEHVRNDSILNSPETATPAPKWWGNVTILNGTVAEELSTLPAEKILSASQKMNVSGHVRNDSILNSPETATPAPKWWSNVTILNGTVAEESSTLPAEKILSASQKMNVSEHVRNDSILNSPETATPAPKWWGNVTILNGTVAEESSTLPAEKILSASQKMNVSEHVRNDSILNSPETATPAPKWWGNVTILNGTVAEESSTLPAEKILSASQKMNVSEHVRNDSILNSPETATPAPKWWGNVTILNGTVAEESSTLPAEKILSASQKMNISGHVRNDSILNSPETATPAPKWWGNVTILNGTVAEESSTLPAEKVLSASQKMNVSGHVRNDSILNSPETATPAPKWWGNVTVSNGTVAEESSILQAEKVLSASQKMNISGHVRNDSILNSPETTTLAPKWWGNVTVSNGTVAEERWTTQDQQNSSVTSSPGVSNIETSPFKRNESIVEEGTPGLSVERRFENVISLNVTQNPKCHALNHTLDRDIGGNDSSWSDERNSTASPSSFRSNISLATDLSAPFPAERIFFSNVTNTSFQISWTTHFSANTTFHVLLFEEELLIKKVKTQSSHLNISELKAGTLYTVKIKADLYGNESKTVQRKVKTAAQKFNGMVRIVNLNYSSEFSNSRSEKRQKFSKMFLNEVRTSLPPNILQKMDAGMINISIVSIIPGSIVVNYSLLIPIDMDARNVSGSLLEAFRNSSHFEVDNSSLSIYDNNECEREETDCSPNATCYNIYGSYGCKCKEGFVNVNAERPGRNCEVLSSSLSSGDARSKEWSSIALPLTDPYTSDPMPSSAGDNFSTSSSRNLENATANTTINKKTINRTTNIHDLPQNSSLINGSTAVSIKEAVQVLCEFEKIVISIKKDFLHRQSIPESSLYLGNPRCNVTSSNSSHVVLHTDWNECETEIQTNTTHTIAKTVLRNDYSSHRIIRYLKISSQIHCTFENNLLTSSGYTSEGIYTIFEDLHGSGHFLTEMRLFIGNSPIPQNFSISGSDNIMIEVGVQTRSKKLKLVVGQCWATPTNNSMDPHSFHFIHGSCPVPNINTIVIANGISNRARFKLKIFSFVNSSVVYLHCKIKICVEIPKSTCRTNCEGFRFWKSGEIIATPKTTWGPLHKFSAGLKEEKKSGLGVGYIVLIVTGVLVLALGIAGLLVCRHKRKAGTYDFKRRTEYFNYRAFHD